MPHPLALANAAYLEQGARLLRGLSDAQYRNGSPPFSQSGVGGHFRHCLEHLQLLLAAADGSRLDYDLRPRDPRLETDRDAAIEAAERLIRGLEGLTDAQIAAPLNVRMDCGDGQRATALWMPSSLGRELQFMVSHTTHHYALIAMILRHQGLEPGADFGVASSTLLHRRGLTVAGA